MKGTYTTNVSFAEFVTQKNFVMHALHCNAFSYIALQYVICNLAMEGDITWHGMARTAMAQGVLVGIYGFFWDQRGMCHDIFAQYARSPVPTSYITDHTFH